MTALLMNAELVFGRPAGLLIMSTLVLIAALVACRFLSRSAAVRHSILLFALIAVGALPIMLYASSSLSLPSWITLPIAGSSGSNVDQKQLADPVSRGRAKPKQSRFPLTLILSTAWAAGLLISLARLLRGLWRAARIRSRSRVLPAQRASLLHGQLVQILGRAPPRILLSDRTVVPVTVGFLRPMVFLPLDTYKRRDDRQVLQIVLHECAHAFRRDTVVGLYQELLLALWWFHPLIYWVNRLLDESREAVCDNFVLQTTPSAEYSRTLLSVAQSVPSYQNERFTPALVRSQHGLEKRIMHLLHPRRCIMTKVGTKTFAVIGTAFLGGTFLLCCIAAQTAPGSELHNPLSNQVQFTTAHANFKQGDSITIQDIRGTSNTLSAGNIYQVTGTYKLASEDRASLAAFVTTSRNQGSASTPVMHTQTMTISKGEGRFTLIFYMWQNGTPHVSFYSASSGNAFAGIYFDSDHQHK
jgi:beta-lactamase regulating signal transducer with metallopeptidase domain